jgi:hypothetical protein
LFYFQVAGYYQSLLKLQLSSLSSTPSLENFLMRLSEAITIPKGDITLVMEILGLRQVTVVGDRSDRTPRNKQIME